MCRNSFIVGSNIQKLSLFDELQLQTALHCKPASLYALKTFLPENSIDLQPKIGHVGAGVGALD